MPFKGWRPRKMSSKCCPSQAFKYSCVLWEVSEEKVLGGVLREPQPDGAQLRYPALARIKIFRCFDLSYGLSQLLSSALACKTGG